MEFDAQWMRGWTGDICRLLRSQESLRLERKEASEIHIDFDREGAAQLRNKAATDRQPQKIASALRKERTVKKGRKGDAFHTAEEEKN